MRTLWIWGVGLALVFILGFVVAARFGLFDEAQVEAALVAIGASPHRALWIGGGVFALLAADLALPVPSSIVITLAGMTLGWRWGALASAAGMLAGALIGYGLCAILGRRALRRMADAGELSRAQAFMDRYGAWAMVLGRAVPMVPEIIACLAGLVRFPFRRFVALSAAGIVPYALVLAWAGDAGVRGDHPALPLLALAIPGLGLLWLRLRHR
jgi:uncharacterized membrane protein YdjX (TVP38/TMEM64 family)